MNETWRAIASEAELAAEHIGVGVTALARANYAHRGHYPEAFFALSVGLERSAKLAIVLDSAIENGGEFPEEKVYRKYGHKLDELLKASAEIAERRSGDEKILPESEIQSEMLAVLSDFASNVTRYYNLDVLAGRGADEDPISAWYSRVTTKVLAEHDKPRSKERREKNARAVGAIMSGRSVIRYESETGDSLTSAEPASLRTAETEFARPWERMYLLQYGRFFYHLMSSLSSAGQAVLGADIPYLDDFFKIYNNKDSFFRERKSWSIY